MIKSCKNCKHKNSKGFEICVDCNKLFGEALTGYNDCWEAKDD